MDSKAECDQLNLANETKTKNTRVTNDRTRRGAIRMNAMAVVRIEHGLTEVPGMQLGHLLVNDG